MDNYTNTYNMVQEVIGREDEKKILKEALNSGEAELVALYGRRRVGKTFLVRNYFAPQMVFELTGMHEASLQDQLFNFTQALQETAKMAIPPAVPQNWIQAFAMLTGF